MTALRMLIGPAARIGPTIANACPSSWISWIVYWSAFAVLNDAGLAHEWSSADPAFWVVGGALVAFFGAALAIQRHMQLSLQANTFGAPRRLVTSGIFGLSRNPIYTAFLMPLASLAVLSPIVSAIAIFGYVLAMNRFVIRHEERVLARLFGKQYAEYCRSVPRWLF